VDLDWVMDAAGGTSGVGVVAVPQLTIATPADTCVGTVTPKDHSQESFPRIAPKNHSLLGLPRNQSKEPPTTGPKNPSV
jgi:hypothetical protein